MQDLGIFLKTSELGNFFDLQIKNDDLEGEDGLRTAVTISLFTDARADADEADPITDLRGWWGDMLLTNDVTGSKLWLLDREKQVPETLTKAQQWASDALQWLIEDGVAESIDVTASFPTSGALSLIVSLTRPNGKKLVYTFDNAWNAEASRG